MAEDGRDEEPRELDPDEREDIEADLEDLGGMQQVFEPQGVRGVVIACPDCGSNHFYEWDLLRENLEYMLQSGEPRMHEPAYEPREDEYIQWDYGKGYIDALADAGLGMARTVDATSRSRNSRYIGPVSREPTRAPLPRLPRLRRAQRR